MNSARAVAVKLIGLLLFCSLPLRHWQLNSGYGYRMHPISHSWKMHAGIDLAACHDTVMAVLDGTVGQCAFDNRLGLYVRIAHTQGMETIYGHLSQWLVLPGDTVLAGEAIAITGSTGVVTGEHLHFAIKYHNSFIDPLHFFVRMVIAYHYH